MDEFDAVEIIKTCWIEKAETLATQDIKLVTCPYCGKSDRIRIINSQITAENDRCSEAMALLGKSGGDPAYCAFCTNIIVIKDDKALMPGD